MLHEGKYFHVEAIEPMNVTCADPGIEVYCTMTFGETQLVMKDTVSYAF